MYINEPFEPKVFERYFLDQSRLAALERPICIMGVPDLTNLGEECTKYLITELKAEKILELHYSDFNPVCYVEEQTKTVEIAKIEYHLVEKFQDKTDFILISGNGLPLSPIGINFIAEKIAEFVCSFKPQLFLAITPALIPHPTQTPQLYLAHTSANVLQIFKDKDLKFKPFERGIVIGLNGLAIGYAKKLFEVEGCLLLAEMFKSNTTDYKAMKVILEALNTVFDLQLSFNSLNLKIKESSRQNQKEPPSDAEILKKMRELIQN